MVTTDHRGDRNTKLMKDFKMWAVEKQFSWLRCHTIWTFVYGLMRFQLNNKWFKLERQTKVCSAHWFQLHSKEVVQLACPNQEPSPNLNFSQRVLPFPSATAIHCIKFSFNLKNSDLKMNALSLGAMSGTGLSLCQFSWKGRKAVCSGFSHCLEASLPWMRCKPVDSISDLCHCHAGPFYSVYPHSHMGRIYFEIKLKGA